MNLQIAALDLVLNQINIFENEFPDLETNEIQKVDLEIKMEKASWDTITEDQFDSLMDADSNHFADALAAIMYSQGCSDLDELIRLFELEFSFYPAASEEKDLGYELVENGVFDVPDELKPYIDYEAIGRDFGFNGCFTCYGFIEFH